MITYPSKCEMEFDFDNKKISVLGEMCVDWSKGAYFLADIRTAKWKENDEALSDIEKNNAIQYLKTQKESALKIIIIDTEEEAQKYICKPTYEAGLRGDEIEILCKKIKKTKAGYKHIALSAWYEYIKNNSQMKYEKVCFYSENKVMRINEICFIDKKLLTYYDEKTIEGYQVISGVLPQNFNKKDKGFSFNQKLHLMLKYIRMK